MLCPNCGAPVTEAQALCPNCGGLLDGVWPPAPSGTPPLPPPRPQTLTGRVWTDFLLGAAVQYLTHLVTARVLIRGLAGTNSNDPQHYGEAVSGLFVTAGEGFWAVVLGLLLYYGTRRFFPLVARGSGYATLALLAVLLGAFFTCHPLAY